MIRSNVAGFWILIKAQIWSKPIVLFGSWIILLYGTGSGIFWHKNCFFCMAPDPTFFYTRTVQDSQPFTLKIVESLYDHIPPYKSVKFFCIPFRCALKITFIISQSFDLTLPNKTMTNFLYILLDILLLLYACLFARWDESLLCIFNSCLQAQYFVRAINSSAHFLLRT